MIVVVEEPVDVSRVGDGVPHILSDNLVAVDFDFKAIDSYQPHCSVVVEVIPPVLVTLIFGCRLL